MFCGVKINHLNLQLYIKKINMNKEEKQLLLKDLCARVMYQPKVYIEGDWVEDEIDSYNTTLTLEKLVDYKNNNYILKPYLRSMSNMTDEEREEWADLFNLELDKLNEIDDEDEAEEKAPLYFGNSHSVSIDWLNKNMFDYHGLIGKGLALEAPEDMYKF